MLSTIHDICTRSSLYGLVLGRSLHGQLRNIQQDSWPSVALNTRNLSAGLYQACNSTLTIAEMLKLLSEPKLDQETVCLHTFDFLRELQALGDNNSRRLARQCINHWLENNSQWSKKPWRRVSWNLDILGYRLCNWLGFYEFFANSADDQFRKNLIASIAQQYRFLKSRYLYLKDPVSKFRALKGLIYAGCSLPREQNQLGKWVSHIKECLQEQFDENFNHQSRHPGTVVLLLRDLIDLRLLLRHYYAGQIDYLNECIQRIAPIVRHLRFGDGMLSSFTGNVTQRLEAFCSPVLGEGLIDMALSLADSNNAFMPESTAMGYSKCVTKAGFILINTQPSIFYTDLQDWYSKATGVLDFEWSEKARRMITRGDLSVYAYDSQRFMRYETFAKPLPKKKIIHDKDCAFFSAEYLVNSAPGKLNPCGAVFQARRELYISSQGDIRGEDFFLLSQAGQGCIRLLAAPGLEWRVASDTDDKSAFLCKRGVGAKSQKLEHLKRFLCQGDVRIHTANTPNQQALCIVVNLFPNQQTSVKWALSPAN